MELIPFLLQAQVLNVRDAPVCAGWAPPVPPSPAKGVGFQPFPGLVVELQVHEQSRRSPGVEKTQWLGLLWGGFS